MDSFHKHEQYILEMIPKFIGKLYSHKGESCVNTTIIHLPPILLKTSNVLSLFIKNMILGSHGSENVDDVLCCNAMWNPWCTPWFLQCVLIELSSTLLKKFLGS